MRRRTVLLGLLAASCTSPEPAYYTLAPVPSPSAIPRSDVGEGSRSGPPDGLDADGASSAEGRSSAKPSPRQGATGSAAPAGGGPRTVQLRRPGLAGYLDRPEIVRGSGPYQLRVAGTERWGESLGDLIGRVTAENLSTRLPAATVFTEAGSITADADATVELDIQRFDADASGQVLLLAQAAVQRGREREDTRTRTLRLTATPASGSTADLVAAMSQALGQLADEVVEMLRAGTRTTAQPVSRRGRAR